MNHIKWPSIEGFSHIHRAVELYAERTGSTTVAHNGPIRYRPKVKLHGTNAGIGLSDGAVSPQSRTSVLSVENDNAGFARWVEENGAGWTALAATVPAGSTMTIFGEWCGPGIQKGVAVCDIPEKIFAIFSVQIDDLVYIEPDWIAARLGPLPGVYVLPWDEPNVEIDWTDRDSMRAAVDGINARVVAVEACDPFVKDRFGVEGTGEGLVYFPIGLADESGAMDREMLAQYMFKAKGEKHQVVRSKAPATVDPETARNIEEFVQLFVTPNRLEQIATESCGAVYDPQNTGRFLGAFAQDVQKESGAELEASGLEWKTVQKAVTAAARGWFIEQTKTI